MLGIRRGRPDPFSFRLRIFKYFGKSSCAMGLVAKCGFFVISKKSNKDSAPWIIAKQAQHFDLLKENMPPINFIPHGNLLHQTLKKITFLLKNH